MALLCVLCAACGRKRTTEEQQPAPSSSVITLSVELGACTDVAACERECDAGSADRCRRLAVSYAFGKGVPKDEAHATALYDRACAMNDPSACVFAGQMNEFGRGVPKDDAKAARYYERACDFPWAAGCYNLAIMYERGTGVPPDRDMAIEFYRRSCTAGARQGCEKEKELRAMAPIFVFEAGAVASDGGR
jgi:TPR repeat protein